MSKEAKHKLCFGAFFAKIKAPRDGEACAHAARVWLKSLRTSLQVSQNSISELPASELPRDFITSAIFLEPSPDFLGQNLR
jgi:hypothetical protein